jgi:hypothetical protein
MLRKTYVVVYFLLCLSTLTLSIGRVQAQASTAVRVDPTYSTENIGGTFVVNVNVTDVANLTGWQLNLYYLNAILNCSNLAEGPFLKSAPSGTYHIFTITNNYNSTYGRISATCVIKGLDWTVNGSGVILMMTFKAIGGGSTDLTLANTKLSNETIPPGGIQHDDFSGTVNVVGAVHDVAVTNVSSSKTTVGKKYNANITVTVANLGGFIENLTTTVYANGIHLADPVNTTLTAGGATNFTTMWNTTGFAYGNYTISAYVMPVPGEADTANNNYTDGWVIVSIPGDINGDFRADLRDLVLLANAYGTNPSSGGIPGVPRAWNANADIDSNGVVGLSDLVILATHYGQHFP